jgi:hypothetical protein
MLTREQVDELERNISSRPVVPNLHKLIYDWKYLRKIYDELKELVKREVPQSPQNQKAPGKDP